MSNEILVASQEDYVKFKKFLRFFVRQANKNAKNGGAESPTKIEEKTPHSKRREFMEHYGLKPGFNSMAGGKLDFAIWFFKCGRHNTVFSTYINIHLLNIIAKFDSNKKITALRNLIRMEIPNEKIIEPAASLCEKWNRKLGFRSIETLGIDNDNDDEPNESLKEMFDEYLSMYNELYELVKSSTVKK
jgi:hypothetical protein